MMIRHFRLSSELSGAIVKRLPHAKNQFSVTGSFFNQFVTDRLYIYMAANYFSEKIFRNRDASSKLL